ncbi:MAG: transcription antitermination factor NusB [Candidatus Cloacimonetes bacterium]|nr:transcription antitermination factor NusB [Candidatus Cloacimonadota bacterium]
MGIRRQGREIVVQTLYSLEFLRQNLQLEESELTDKLTEISKDKKIKDDTKIFEFASDILINLNSNISEIDKKIKEHSINWSFDRIAKLDLSILRVATYEMLYTDTAPAIIMNEAIEIAKKYCSESSGKFINGVLNAIAEELNERKD